MSRAVIWMLAVFGCIFQLDAAPTYYWRAEPVGQPATAQLLTLFCEACGTGTEVGHDIPLVGVLRDTLGKTQISTYRVTAVWLFSYSRPTVGQRALAALPFFYWSLSDGSPNVKHKDTGPILDLSAPEHPVISNLTRQLIQWTALDTVGLPVRATSRAYRTNEVDHERLHLEEANTYLLRAPVGDGQAELTAAERDFVMARLELRKKLLGGFVKSSLAPSLGREASFEQERIRSRNWELLRQCAERTGLVFEGLTLSGSAENYGMLWYPVRAQEEPGGNSLNSIWKLLDIKNPYADDRLAHWTGLTTDRPVAADGVILRPGDELGTRTVKLIPLGVYSLSYPRQPLLLVDFRDKLNLRRHDLTQKAIDEVTGGIIGLSHFTNWYYFVASDAYNFVQERRGRANNRAERLDSYSEFRVSLALDRSLDPPLRAEMQRRAAALVTNPMVSSPANEMAAALNRYQLLMKEARGDGSRLQRAIGNQRREELAAFNATPRRLGLDFALHTVTLGKYTHRAPVAADNLSLLSVYRRVEHNLEFLEMLVAEGTPPEVAYQQATVQASVNELNSLMPQVMSPSVRERARRAWEGLARISQSQQLRADCDTATASLNRNRDTGVFTVPGVLASPPSGAFLEKH